MKELFIQYSTYHTWANGLLLAAITNLSEEQQHAEVKSSFPGLFKTTLHMCDAESIWWQRMKMQEKIILPSESFSGNMNELANQLLQQNKQWQDWIAGANEPALQHEFIYYNSKKEKFKQPVYQMLLHLFNHGTYHRGQLVTILRQLKIENIPHTDFIIWSRRKQ